jgi:hypothetical protein
MAAWIKHDWWCFAQGYTVRSATGNAPPLDSIGTILKLADQLYVLGPAGGHQLRELNTKRMKLAELPEP